MIALHYFIINYLKNLRGFRTMGMKHTHTHTNTFSVFSVHAFPLSSLFFISSLQDNPPPLDGHTPVQLLYLTSLLARTEGPEDVGRLAAGPGCPCCWVSRLTLGGECAPVCVLHGLFAEMFSPTTVLAVRVMEHTCKRSCVRVWTVNTSGPSWIVFIMKGKRKD